MKRRVLVSGASGALGSFLLKVLLERRLEDTEIVGVFRSRGSYEECLSWLNAAAGSFTAVFCDLTLEAEVSRVARDLAPVEQSVGIHCAADVSWSKALDVVSPLNIGGTLAFASLVERSARKSSLLYVSSAYTRREGWDYANAYEQSKALADVRVRAQHPSMPVTTLSCSLIAGAAEDGRIARFNGIYPLMRLMATAATPVLVSDKSYDLDIVPVDWVCREIMFALDAHFAGAALPEESVLAATGGRLNVHRFNDIVYERASRFRMAHGVPPMPKVGVISPRQHAFLQRSAPSWGFDDVFYHLERYYTFFREYVEHSKVDKVRARENAQSAPPRVEAYFHKLVDYWLVRNQRRALSTLAPAWKDVVAPTPASAAAGLGQ